jgi:hypothetical protein
MLDRTSKTGWFLRRFRCVGPGTIPYPNPGTPNTVTYSFTAASDEHVIAYFAGSTAAFDNRLGLIVNGTMTAAGFGLDNHTSLRGDQFDLGFVHAGDSLVFVMEVNLGASGNVYSDPSQNVAYDSNGTRGHNHIYSTDYQAGQISSQGINGPIPAGTFVSFEDQSFPNSDFNYNDEDFVFSNVMAQVAGVPEPASLTMLGIGASSLFGYGWRRKRAVQA